MDRLRALLPRALEALEQELEHGKQPGRVAVEILRLAGLDRSGRTDRSLATYGVGLTDGDAIIDSHARARRPDPIAELLHGEPVTEAERLSAIEELLPGSTLPARTVHRAYGPSEVETDSRSRSSARP